MNLTKATTAIPWNAWGFVYMGSSIGVAIGLARSGVDSTNTVSIPLWAMWGILLLLGSAGIAVFCVRNERPGATGIETLVLALKMPLLLASYMVPGVLFRRKPFSEKSGVIWCLSRSQTIKLLIPWSLWGLFCAVLAGIYKFQAGSFVLFGAIFLVPAIIGWARFQGFLPS